jgi:hypothetical protein
MTQGRQEETMVPGFDEAGLDIDASEIFSRSPSATSGATPMGTTEASLADMFRDFDSGVRRRSDGTECGTRYALGLAFLDVGLLDEAIAEFTLAATDDSRAPECTSMIGLCYMEKEMPEAAVAWFDRCLAALPRSD